MHKQTRKYSLETVQEVYSYWGKSRLAYSMGVSFLGFDSYIRNKAVDALKIREGQAIMDLACGPGIMFRRIEKRIGSRGKLIGVDYVREMIWQCERLVRRRKWNNVILIQEDAAKLKLKKASLDGIISIVGLSAIPDHKKTLANCYSALKKGGRLVILDGKDFSGRLRFLNPLLRLLRWSKSYEKKDLIHDIKKRFGNISVTELFLGSTFIAVSVKK
jgi:ubiquinone/menaquinone biosynthesis C-methylase UbiE